MKKTILSLALLLFAVLFSCQRDPEQVTKNDIPEDVISKLEAAGLRTDPLHWTIEEHLPWCTQAVAAMILNRLEKSLPYARL